MANYPVSVAFEGEECGFNLTAILLSKIEVTKNPNKRSYQPGEVLNYSGIVVTATYDDQTTANVTSRCIFTPAAGEAFESPVEIVYAEGQDEKSCSLTLAEVSPLRIYIASQPDKTVYHSGETIDYTGLVVKAVYSDDSEIDVTNRCSYSSESGQPFDPDNDTSIEISYLDCSTTLSLTAIILTGISVTSNPAKMSYEAGEVIDYTGLVVTASYSDGSTKVVTSSCAITPRAGKVFDPETDSTAEISYTEDGEEFTATLMLTDVYLVSIEVTTNPAKMSYLYREWFDYTGLVVTASYSDGHTANVTNACTISPAERQQMLKREDIDVTITYTEGGITETTSLTLIYIYEVMMPVTQLPVKTAYRYNDRLDYTGLVVEMQYSDGSSKDITAECKFTPGRYNRFYSDTDVTVEIYYDTGSGWWYNDEQLVLTAIPMTSLSITRNPYKMTYSSGEAISYYGIIVTANYEDGSTLDVTDYCDITPLSGTAFSASHSYATVAYKEGENKQSCTLNFIEVSMKLVIETLPTKTTYEQGEEVDYTGAVIKAIHTDSSTHDVTEFCTYTPMLGVEETTVLVKCTLPETPYRFDMNYGYVDNGTWKYESPTNTYIDIYRVTAGHKYLLAIGSNVGSRFRAMFTTTDVSTATANVSGTAIINKNNPSANSTVSYTPTFSGYLVIGKDNVGKTGVRTFLYDADNLDKKVTTTFALTTVGMLESIAITPPVKQRYRIGETYDYGGAVVTAIYKDGSTKDVTEDAVFNPAEGTTVVSSGSAELATQTVSVSYKGKTDSFDLATGGFAIVSLEVTAPPDKTVYYLQEDFDLTGFIVTAVYADGSRKDVTDKVELNRSAMTDFAIEDEYSDLTRNIPVSVEITYEELDETLVDNIISDEVIASIDETRGIDSADEYKDFSLGIQNVHEIQYLDTSSGKIRTLTYHTFVSQPDGVFDMIDDDYMYVTADRYQRLVEITREDNEYWQSHPEYEGNVTVLEMSTACGHFGPVTSGQQYGYDEVVIDCVLKYDMNTITGKYFTYPVTEGTVGYTSYSRGFVPVLQLCYGAEASTTMNLYCKMIRSMAITTPTKASYHYGEAFDTTGITAEVTFTDGEVRDVSADVTISPAQGTAITRTQSGTVRYRNPVGGDNTSDSFSITLIALQGLDITPPTKTSYRYGEIIDYTGARVIAVYSDNSREDVTSAVTFSPSAGTAITGDTTVSVSYTNQWRETAIESITLTLATLVSLSATNPTKTEYTTGETIDYSGMVVTAEFSDGTTEDVTDSCSITPRAGKAFNPSTDTVIHIEYATGEAMRSTEINFGVATLESITITANPTKMHYISGETINYSGLAVTASYANGNSWSVTSSCNITPRAGKAFDPSTDTNVTISYTDNGITQTASLTLLAGELQGIEVTKYMDNPCTTTMDYTGMVVTATYSDGTADVTDSCTFSPSAGAAVSNTVTITYTEKEITKNCTFTLDKAYLGLIVETPPTKTTYTPGETVDYSGAMIKMVYSDGTEHDVTDFCSYMPVVDGETTTVTVSCAPAEKAFAEAVYGYIARSIAWEYSSVPYTSRPTSIYRVTAGHTYFIAVGFASNIDFDVSFTTTDVSQATSDVTGNVISYTTKSKGAGIVYTPTSDGYINVGTCRVSGRYPNYLYDANAENKTVTTTFTLTTQGV